jgi:DNA mismatch repair protein MutH
MTEQQSISAIFSKLITHVGKPKTCPLTRNKGLPGLFIEEIVGIPHTPNCLDCVDGELKLFPLKRLKNGTLAPKETIAVTMLQPESLRTIPFTDSNVFRKLSRCLYIPYLRDEETIVLHNPYILDLSKNAEIQTQLEADYNEIASKYITENKMTGSIGRYLQTRTKGAGHGSTSRAFYLRPQFIKEYVLPHTTL